MDMVGSKTVPVIVTWAMVAVAVVPSSVHAEGNCDGNAILRFYQHSNYSGGCRAFNADEPDLGNDRFDNPAETPADNEITSFRIKPGYKVTFFVDANYQGASREFLDDVSDLNAHNFNDMITSFRISSAAEDCTDTSILRIFHHANYSGGCKAFGSDDSDLSNDVFSDGASADNEITSFRIQAGYRVTFFVDANHQGTSREFTLDDEDLNGDGINDVITSFRITSSATGSCASGGTLRIYQHANFGGGCRVVNADDPDLAGDTFENGVPANNEITSFHIEAGYKVTFFDGANYQGTSREFTADDTDLNGEGINDMITSIRLTSAAPGEECMASSILRVYHHANYDGGCRAFSTDDADLANDAFSDGASANNEITSFHIQAGYKVTFFDGANYQGTSREFTGDDTDLNGEGINDMITSLRITSTTTGTCASGAALRIYQHANYDGGCRAISADEPDLAGDTFENGVSANNEITSFHIQAGFKVTFYADANYQGTSREFTADDTDLNGESINDMITSIRLSTAGGPTPPPPPPPPPPQPVNVHHTDGQIALPTLLTQRYADQAAVQGLTVWKLGDAAIASNGRKPFQLRAVTSANFDIEFFQAAGSTETPLAAFKGAGDESGRIPENANRAYVTMPTGTRGEFDFDIWSSPSGNHNPNPPTNPSPGNGATVNTNNPQLSWQAGGDPDGDPVTYRVYLDASSFPSSLKCGPTADLSCQVTGLLGASTYHWRVEVEDEWGAVNYAVWSFTTQNAPPALPSNPHPSDGLNGWPLQAELGWFLNGDPEGHPVYARVFLGTSNPPTAQACPRQLDRTACPFSGLTPETWYWWKVIVDDGQGGEASITWTFRTMSPTGPQPCFTHTEVGRSVTVDGGCSYDSDGGPLSYTWNWGDATTTGRTSTHTYAGCPGGDVVVQLTVVDNEGESASTQQVVLARDLDDDDDGLENCREAIYGTSPVDVDSDDDQLWDQDEVDALSIQGRTARHASFGTYTYASTDRCSSANAACQVGAAGGATDPLDADSDDDGLSDGLEVHGVPGGPCSTECERWHRTTYFLNPNRADTDGDAMADATEINVYYDGPAYTDDGRVGYDANGNPGGCSNCHFRFDPTDVDRDHDFASDLDEQNMGTDPFWADSDRDLLPDGAEMPSAFNTNPKRWSSDLDAVGDLQDTDNTADNDPPAIIKIAQRGSSYQEGVCIVIADTTDVRLSMIWFHARYHYNGTEFDRLYVDQDAAARSYWIRDEETDLYGLCGSFDPDPNDYLAIKSFRVEILDANGNGIQVAANIVNANEIDTLDLIVLGTCWIPFGGSEAVEAVVGAYRGDALAVARGDVFVAAETAHQYEWLNHGTRVGKAVSVAVTPVGSCLVSAIELAVKAANADYYIANVQITPQPYVFDVMQRGGISFLMFWQGSADSRTVTLAGETRTFWIGQGYDSLRQRYSSYSDRSDQWWHDRILATLNSPSYSSLPAGYFNDASVASSLYAEHLTQDGQLWTVYSYRYNDDGAIYSIYDVEITP